MLMEYMKFFCFSIQYRTRVRFCDMLYFEHNSHITIDVLHKHIIPYDVDKLGLTMETVLQGLFIYHIRPHKETTTTPKYTSEEDHDYKYAMNFSFPTNPTKKPTTLRTRRPFTVSQHLQFNSNRRHKTKIKKSYIKINSTKI